MYLSEVLLPLSIERSFFPTNHVIPKSSLKKNCALHLGFWPVVLMVECSSFVCEYFCQFGAYFGLATAWALGPKSAKDHLKNTSTKQSDMFAMVGTLFLWMFWPSFNGALAAANQQHRVVINTVLALVSFFVVAWLPVEQLLVVHVGVCVVPFKRLVLCH